MKKAIDRGFNPAWSPDGQRLAFSTQPTTANPGSRMATDAEIWAVTVATGETRRLTDNDGMQPVWSPDGTRIAYWGFVPKSRNREIWTVPGNGGEPNRITDNPAIDWNPVWAHDGRHLLRKRPWRVAGSLANCDRYGVRTTRRDTSAHPAAGSARRALQPVRRRISNGVRVLSSVDAGLRRGLRCPVWLNRIAGIDHPRVSDLGASRRLSRRAPPCHGDGLSARGHLCRRCKR